MIVSSFISFILFKLLIFFSFLSSLFSEIKTSSIEVVEIVYLMSWFSFISYIFLNILFISSLSFVLNLITTKFSELILIILLSISLNWFIKFCLSSAVWFSFIIKLKLNPFEYFFFKKEKVPEHIYLPSLIIPILSLKNSASSKKWVVIIIILSFLFSFKNFHNSFLEFVSNPEVGSSKRIILLFPIKDKAILNFLFSPFDKCLHNLFSISSNFI